MAPVAETAFGIITFAEFLWRKLTDGTKGRIIQILILLKEPVNKIPQLHAEEMYLLCGTYRRLVSPDVLPYQSEDNGLNYEQYITDRRPMNEMWKKKIDIFLPSLVILLERI